jgi:hypothetical protein
MAGSKTWLLCVLTFINRDMAASINHASSTVESTAAVGYLHHLSEMNVTVQVPKNIV